MSNDKEASVVPLTAKERVEIEKMDLDLKIGKLIEFLKTPNQLLITQTELLNLQLKYMKHYASCLNLRIDNW